MIAFLGLVLHIVVSPFKTQARLEAEIVLLRHQLSVLRQRVPSKPRLTMADRLLFVWLYRLFPLVLNAVTIVQPETVIRWHRTGFRLYWRWKSRSRGGRPQVPVEIRRLIREMSLAKSAVGRTAHTWRTAQARHRGRPIDGRQVHGEERARAVADLVCTTMRQASARWTS